MPDKDNDKDTKKELADSKKSEGREKAACLVELEAHLAAFGKESDIGQNDDYWMILNRYRGYN